MRSSSQALIRTLAWIAAGMIVIVVFHIGQGSLSLRVGQFAPVIGAFIGGSVALVSATSRQRRSEEVEPWIKYEQWGWVLIGCGVIIWGLGDSCWRYYISMGQTPFPSIADIGYFIFPLMILCGLLLQPPSRTGNKHYLLLLDSLISMGSILAISWFLLLGSLAQSQGEANLAKFLGIYYPVADTALLSCVIFLLMRGQGRAYQATARRVSLMVLGLGLVFFVFSDFAFNVLNNSGTYAEGTWLDMGWPLGMMTIGIAAHLRRALPATPEDVIDMRAQERSERVRFGIVQLLPYGLLTVLFSVLTYNVLSLDATQRAIRPVLLLVTLGVVALVVFRQILTLRDNLRLAERQAQTLEGLERANRQIEDQSLQIARHSAELELGIEHLKEVQANLANGNLKARARLDSGELFPLAASLNLMADRLTKMWQTNAYAQRMSVGLGDLSIAFDRHWNGQSLVIPESCNDIVEINRLLLAMRLRGQQQQQQSGRPSLTGNLLKGQDSVLSPTPMQPYNRRPAGGLQSTPMTLRQKSSRIITEDYPDKEPWLRKNA